MHGIQFGANNISFVLASAINKEVIKAKVSYLALNNCLHDGPSSNNYSI